VQGPRVCLPKALAYLAIGVANLALLLLPAAAPRRTRWRGAAAAALRVAYLVPALTMMDACRLGPGSVVDGLIGGGGGGGGVGSGSCAQAWKGVVKLLVYDTGAVYLLW
jgi:hypothetical protein